MADDDGLFVSSELSEFLARQRAAADDTLLSWDADRLLSTPDLDIVDRLLEVARVERIVLDLDAIQQLEPTDVTWPDPNSYYMPGPPRQLRGTRYRLAIPFVGDAGLFDLRPDPYYPGPLDAIIDGDMVIVSFNGSTDARSVERGLNSAVSFLRAQVTSSGNNVDQHNRYLEEKLPEKVATRKAKLLRVKDVQASLNYPVLKRSDAVRHEIPVKRRTVDLSVPTDRFVPEPALAERDYEVILSVLLNARNAFERSPSMADKLDEEHIRDLLLLILNAQFEGKAAGEVFNAAGKTDILVRHEDKNVFIGECKIWRGPKSVKGAVDQLLDYLTWRDTKAALIIFIKGGNPTAIASKAVGEVAKHANYKRAGVHASSDRHDFVLHAKGDENREIHLALLPFVVTPPKAATAS